MIRMSGFIQKTPIYNVSRIAVIDYQTGNLHSVAKALEFVGGEVVVTSEIKELEAADKIVLPGVGAFGEGMERLQQLGLIDVLNREVRGKKKPFLGICLGMQLAATVGEEHGLHPGLGWIDARVVRFDFRNLNSPIKSGNDTDRTLKVPHMGWDDVRLVGASPIFAGLESPATFYFVHSYHVVPKDKDLVTGICDYGGEFAAAISFENIYLTQFHPEKSQKKGLKILENFVKF